MTTHARGTLIVLVALTAALIAAGGVVGYSGASAYGVACGSAFAPSDAPGIADFGDTLSGGTLRAGYVGGVQAACDTALSGRRTVALVLLVAGAIGGVAALAYARTARRAPSRPAAEA